MPISPPPKSNLIPPFLSWKRSYDAYQLPSLKDSLSDLMTPHLRKLHLTCQPFSEHVRCNDPSGS